MSISPIIFAKHAGQFLDAAKREAASSAASISLPAYFLVARSIELALKSYLLLEGRQERELRKISHDLGVALDAAQASGLSALLPVAPESEQAVRWINDYYALKDLEYPTTGFKSYPPLHYLVSFAESLLAALQPRLRVWRPA